MGRVIHFEIHADEPERAAKFYSDLFGWQFHKWEGPMEYWLVITGPDNEPGINGGMMKRKSGQSGDIIMAYVCTVNVDSLDDTLAKALSSGAELALPKMPVPGVGWLAYCKDTERNVFGMMQEDKNAGM